MKKTTIILAAFMVLAIVFSVTGCRVVDRGETVTRTYDYTGFTEIQIGNAFELEILPSDEYSIAVTASEGLFERLQVSKSGSRLKIDITGWFFSFRGMKVVITMPEVEGLYLSGATRTDAKGFSSKRDLTIELSGASSLDMDIEAGNTDIEVSGASRIKGGLTAEDSRFHVSGASDVDLQGSGNDIRLEVSGASTMDLLEFPVQDADVELSGASTARLDVSGRLDAELNGASTLRYEGSPLLGSIDSSGGSSFGPH